MHLQAAFLVAKEIGKFFALTALDLLNLIDPWPCNIKFSFNISDGSRNDALPMYTHKKIPKSRKNVPLSSKYND